MITVWSYVQSRYTREKSAKDVNKIVKYRVTYVYAQVFNNRCTCIIPDNISAFRVTVTVRSKAILSAV